MRLTRTIPVLVTVLALAAVPVTAPLAVAGPAAGADRLRAADVDPPGESGLDTLAGFAGGTTGATPTYGPHTQDQLPLYNGWTYKSEQFEGEGLGTAPPGDANVKIWRDPKYGVPTITATSERDAFYGIGYAMAQDRLFQMDVFRHVGHGTLAALIGASGLPMDEAVRRVSEGTAALQADYNAAPAAMKQQLEGFSAGVNADIQQVETDPTQLPSEFALLGDLPIAPWTAIDSLAFGEYAARFFGEFDSSAMADAQTYLDLVKAHGQATAEKIYADFIRLDDPKAPTSIAAKDGRFPRHTGKAVATSYTGSVYANHNPSVLPTLAQLSTAADTIASNAATVKTLQRVLALPRWGSNAVLVSAKLSADHVPMLYGGPQTGWAAPSFLWEAEVHDPVREERGFMVPAIPLFVVGRNATSAWTVTSAEDQNADVYVMDLDKTDTHYVHDGNTLTVQKQTVTLPCNNPPTTLTSLPNAQLCPVPATTMTLYRTVEGPALTDPDAGHHLYVQRSVVDHRLLQALGSWDRAGLQHDVASFGRQLATFPLGFNFFYIDDHGSIGYWHTGLYPIRPRNADPSLPLPGDGSYDWQGFEKWTNDPHVINPTAGYVVNWNNKPSVGWWSPPLLDTEPFIWGDGNEVQPLQTDVPRRSPVTFSALGQIPRDVAYVDNRARLLMPYLLAALKGTTDPQLAAIRRYLAAWNERRNDVSGADYSTPAVVFFDRWYEQALTVVEQPVLGRDFLRAAGLNCASPCHYRSVDNEGTPTYKFEDAVGEALLAALRGETAYSWVGSATRRHALLVQAAKNAAAQLTKEQGSDVAKWNEPVETGAFNSQGAISVPVLDPLPNRGSIGQVFEATGAPGYRAGAASPSRSAAGATLPATGAAAWPAAAGVALLGLALAVTRRRRRAND